MAAAAVVVGILQVLPNILSPDSWLEAVVVVGVMSVKAQLAQGFSTHACQQDWPPSPLCRASMLAASESSWCEPAPEMPTRWVWNEVWRFFLLFIYLF